MSLPLVHNRMELRPGLQVLQELLIDRIVLVTREADETAVFSCDDDVLLNLTERFDGDFFVYHGSPHSSADTAKYDDREFAAINKYGLYCVNPVA